MLTLYAAGCGPSAAPSMVARGPGGGAQAGPAPTHHLVRPGDTVAALARRYDVTVEALAAANDLAPPYTIRAHEELRLPPGAVDRARTYTVRPGDTLSGIAARFGTTVRALTDASDVTDPDHVVAGQVVLVLPDELVPRRSRPPAQRVSTGPALLPPVHGEVVEGFAEAGGGIEIAAAEAGAPVRAAADGVVVYAGPGAGGVAGVILLRHDDGGIAVYARAAEVLVARGDRVERGALIARLPDRDRPRLRFELRENGHKVDPSPRLPEMQYPVVEVSGGPEIDGVLSDAGASMPDPPPPAPLPPAGAAGLPL